MNRTLAQFVIVLSVFALQGCISNRQHVKIDPVQVKFDIKAKVEENRLGDKILESFLGPESTAGPIVAASVAYRMKVGNWPKSKDELLDGLRTIRENADFQDEISDLQFSETDEILTIVYKTLDGETGSITLDPDEIEMPNHSVVTTPAIAPR